MKSTQLTRRSLAGLIRDTASAAALGIAGHVTVDLIDHRTGRTIDRRSGDNYVNTAMWENFAKAVQKSAWYYGYQGADATLTARPSDGRDPRTVPSLRNDHIAAWADTTPENPSDKWPIGEVIAWGHRWPQGSPSTRQGIVQPSLCTITDTAVSWVWEWATPNGNGIFQSVGWRRLAWGATTGDHLIADQLWPAQRLMVSSAFTDAISNATGVLTVPAWTLGNAAAARPMYYNAADSSLYSINLSLASLWKLSRVPITFDGAGNYTVGAIVDESANAIAAAVKGNNLSPSTAYCLGLTRLGASGDWIAVGFTGTGAARRPFITRVTAAGATIYSNANAATYAGLSGMTDVTYDGTNLWVIGLNGTTGASAIHRVDPATGTISATISAVATVPAYFPAWSTTMTPTGIEWDAANSCLWILAGYVYNIDTSGNWGGVLLQHGSIAAATLSGLQPGTSPDLGSDNRDALHMLWNETVAANVVTAPHSIIKSTLGDSLTTTAAVSLGRLFTMNGICVTEYLAAAGNSALAWGSAQVDQSPNFASRTDLGAPVTKTNTQTMRIRYTMTFA